MFVYQIIYILFHDGTMAGMNPFGHPCSQVVNINFDLPNDVSIPPTATVFAMCTCISSTLHQSRHFCDLFKMKTRRLLIIIASLDITDVFALETLSTILLDIFNG